MRWRWNQPGAWIVVVGIILIMVLTDTVPWPSRFQRLHSLSRFLHEAAEETSEGSNGDAETEFRNFMRPLGPEPAFGVASIPFKTPKGSFIQCNLNLHGRSDGRDGCVVVTEGPPFKIVAFYEQRCSENLSVAHLEKLP